MGIDWYKVYGSLERFIITLTLPQLIDDDDDDDIDNDSWAEGARIITEIETDIRKYIEKYKLQ